MPKQGRPADQDVIRDQLNDVFALITDHQTMTWDDLFEVAVQWCRKNYEYPVEIAKQKGVIPNRLTLAALLYVEHPLIIDPVRGAKYGFTRMTVEIMEAELKEIDLVVPVRVSSTASKPAPVEICG